jgi:transposase
MMSKQIRKKYFNEFKHEAIGLVLDQGYSKAEAGRSLGINPDLKRCWQRELDGGGSDAFPGQGKLPPDQQRIRDLENENRRLRMEKEILKKASENSTRHRNT